MQKLKVKGCDKATVCYFTNLMQRALLLFIQTQTSKHQGCIHKSDIFPQNEGKDGKSELTPVVMALTNCAMR